jgi:hypothetical protein
MRRRNGGAQPPARGASAASRIGHGEWRRVARAPGEGEGAAGASVAAELGAAVVVRASAGGAWGQPQAMLEVELWATTCNVRGGAWECLG